MNSSHIGIVLTWKSSTTKWWRPMAPADNLIRLHQYLSTHQESHTMKCWPVMFWSDRLLYKSSCTYKRNQHHTDWRRRQSCIPAMSWSGNAVMTWNEPWELDSLKLKRIGSLPPAQMLWAIENFELNEWNELHAVQKDSYAYQDEEEDQHVQSRIHKCKT